MQLIETQIESLSHEGRGIAKVNGKTTFVRDALPGERIKAQVFNKRGKFNEANCVEVMAASENRIKPHCEYFGTCGGCSMQHLSAEQQIAHKNKVLAEQFTHFGKLTPEAWMAPLSSHPFGYRRKARLTAKVVDKKGGALVGFRERNGRYAMDMTHCDVLHPSIGNKISDLRNLLNMMEAKAQIPQIEVAIDDQRVSLIIRHLQPLSATDQQILKDFATVHNMWIYLQPKGPKTVHRLFPEGHERMSYRLPDHDITIEFEPQDFTQVNSEINRLMINQALELLDLQTDDRVLDLFCGLGNFTLPMAKQAAHVVGIEGDEEMVKRAGENAALNGIVNAGFHAADLFESIAHIPLNQSFDKVLLDPARSGAQEMMHWIGQRAIPHIVYVSCNPATLARDAGILVNEYGYRLIQAGVMDMFPQTAHVESMALFVK